VPLVLGLERVRELDSRTSPRGGVVWGSVSEHVQGEPVPRRELGEQHDSLSKDTRVELNQHGRACTDLEDRLDPAQDLELVAFDVDLDQPKPLEF